MGVRGRGVGGGGSIGCVHVCVRSIWSVSRACIVHAMPGRQVLRGVLILFSGVIPLADKPQEHHLWTLAERFGARCTTVKQDDVTHLVAKNTGTEKVLA